MMFINHRTGCSKEIESIIERQNENGGKFWSREDGNIHAPNGFSTIDCLNVLGELGADINDYPVLSQAFDFVLKYQLKDGFFKYSKSSSKLPCITARILSSFSRLSVHNDLRLVKSYKALLEAQWNDGGWRCATVKIGKSFLTDASNPGTTLHVLDAFRFRKNTKKDISQLNKGIDFLLQHWDIRQPIGPCGFGMGTRFFQLEYPFLRYNLFYYVYILSFYKSSMRSKNFQKAYQLLAEKTNNGKIIPDNPHRAWRKYNFAKKGKVSELGTTRWEEIINNCNNKLD